MTKIAATILQLEIIQPLLIPPLHLQLPPEIAQLQIHPRMLQALHKIRHLGLVRVRAVEIQIVQSALTVLLIQIVQSALTVLLMRAVILLERLTLATVATIQQLAIEDYY